MFISSNQYSLKIRILDAKMLYILKVKFSLVVNNYDLTSKAVSHMLKTKISRQELGLRLNSFTDRSSYMRKPE